MRLMQTPEGARPLVLSHRLDDTIDEWHIWGEKSGEFQSLGSLTVTEETDLPNLVTVGSSLVSRHCQATVPYCSVQLGRTVL